MIIFLVMIIIVLTCCFIAYLLLKDSEDRGTFGDMFGSVNAIFSGLAFAGLIYTILLQKEELGLQRTELKETRSEFHTQNETLKKQQFESTLFNLINLHQEIVNDIEIRKKIKGTGEKAVSEQGRDCFKIFYKRFERNLNKDIRLDTILKEYKEFFDKNQAILGHYFRNLYYILKFIKNSKNISNDLKFEYSCILRALLSSYELVLLFYDGLGEYGVTSFKPLMEEFSLLKNIDKNLLIDPEHVNNFDKLAFADSDLRAEILSNRAKISTQM